MTNNVCLLLMIMLTIAELMIKDSEKYNISVDVRQMGEILDAGLGCSSILAGIKIAEICMGGLGNITLIMDSTRKFQTLFTLIVQSQSWLVYRVNVLVGVQAWERR